MSGLMDTRAQSCCCCIHFFGAVSIDAMLLRRRMSENDTVLSVMDLAHFSAGRRIGLELGLVVVRQVARLAAYKIACAAPAIV
jgi:hypothetical protein